MQDPSSSGGETGGNGENTTGGNTTSSYDFSSGGVFSWLAQGIASIIKNITSILDYLNPTNEKFILKNIIDFLNPASENFILKNIGKVLNDIFTNIGNILSYVNPLHENFLGKKIIELLGNLLQNLFIPKEESFTKFQDIFSEKLGFVENVKSGVNSLKDMFNNVEELPTLSIDIDSKYYKGELTIIDLNWYSQYKTYGDLVITGFCYIFFIWRIWVHLPSILQGSSGVTDIVTTFKQDNVKESSSPWFIKGQKSLFK